MGKPTEKEELFLSQAYEAFFDIAADIKSETFELETPYYRLNKFRDALMIYSEILEYEPIGFFIEHLKTARPPMEAELSKEFLLFLRNMLIHFPFFKSWNEFQVSQKLINWTKPGKSIDKFLNKYCGHAEIKYRIWIPEKKEMEYITIQFPQTYTDETIIFLKDVIAEKEGVHFAMGLMTKVLMSQIESMKNI